MKTCMGAQRPRRPRRTRAPSTKPLLRATATKTVESRASSAWASSGSRASSGSSSLPLPGGVGWERGRGTAGQRWGERPQLGSVLCRGTEPRELPAGQAELVAFCFPPASHFLDPHVVGREGQPQPKRIHRAMRSHPHTSSPEKWVKEVSERGFLASSNPAQPTWLIPVEERVGGWVGTVAGTLPDVVDAMTVVRRAGVLSAWRRWGGELSLPPEGPARLPRVSG